MPAARVFAATWNISRKSNLRRARKEAIIMNISITQTTHPGTLPPSDRLGFGTVFTDHMFLMDYNSD